MSGDFTHKDVKYYRQCCLCDQRFTTGNKHKKICNACLIINQNETDMINELVWCMNQGMSQKVRHKKTGNIYYVIGQPRINCTNGFEHQVMVQYAMPSMAKIFVREESEFWAKFEGVENDY